MKLKSGRTVKLESITVSQRIECMDTITKTVINGSDVALGNLAMAKYKWAAYGLGLDSVDDLKKYTDEEITEISLAVQEADEKAKNPTKKD